MSPEIKGSSGGGGSGGGNPPSVTKRKKNRERKPQSGQLNPSEFNMNIPATAAGSSCNFFPLLSSSNPNLCNHNLSIPDISQYYSFVNYSGAHEPMSLPVYTNYAGPNSFYLNSNSSSLNFMSSPKPVVSQPNGDTTEYLSLPVRNLEDQIDEMSKRRFSDPGVLNDSDSSTNSMENKLIQKLGQQMNALRESNRKLIREMTEMRIELNMLKQQQNSKHYDREYEPGMLADIIREVRDAARVREDALLARVKHMIEEKQFSMNHLQLVSEKNRNNDRITKLEEQLKGLSVNGTRAEEESNHSSDDGNSATARQVIELEREALMLRKELQETRAKKEESEQKLLQLDKKLASILRRNDIPTSDVSEDGKTNSTDTISVITTTSASSIAQGLPRVTLSGPVTDL